MGDEPGHRDGPSHDGLEQGSDVICPNGSRRSAFPRESHEAMSHEEEVMGLDFGARLRTTERCHLLDDARSLLPCVAPYPTAATCSSGSNP